MSNIKQAIEDVKNGKPVIIIDDSDREDECDLCLSANKVNKHNLVFCMNHAKGLMCLASAGNIIDQHELPMMVQKSTCRLGTGFTVSVDNAKDITTGMSVYDRLKTIETFVNPNSKPDDLSKPGHLFPLRANENLLKGRRGHTEGSVCLMLLAGLDPVAVIVEIMNNDGTMTRGKQMDDFAGQYNLTVVSVQDIYDAFYS